MASSRPTNRTESSGFSFRCVWDVNTQWNALYHYPLHRSTPFDRWAERPRKVEKEGATAYGRGPIPCCRFSNYLRIVMRCISLPSCSDQTFTK